MIHLHSGILIYIKEWIWVSWPEVDYISYTEWNKTERKQISYINAYIYGNLEKWYWWTYFQGRNRDADIENGLVDTDREGKHGNNWESSTETYTLLWVKYRELSSVLCDDWKEWDAGGGKMFKKKGINVYL